LVLHTCYKLAYIKLACVGAEEQEEEQAVGNPDVKNWQDEAWKILECMMQEFFNSQPRVELAIAVTPTNMNPAPSCHASILFNFYHHLFSLVVKDDEEGWPAELCCYLI